MLQTSVAFYEEHLRDVVHGHAPLRLPYQYVVASGVPIPKVEDDPRAAVPPYP